MRAAASAVILLAACVAAPLAQVTSGVVPGTSVAGQLPRDGQLQTGTARLRGRVTNDSGQPVRRVPVRLFGTTTRVVNTDTNGRFDFTALPAGRYTINANRQGYSPGTSDPIDVSDGEQRENVSVVLVRGAVITGQVVDEFGEPVIGATVVPLRSQFSQGRRQLTASGQSASTNDIGEYRLFGLAAGAYYISVTARNESATMVFQSQPGAPPTPLVSSSPDGYAPTYYPGTSDPASAQRVTVTAAQTLSNINISLTPTTLAKVSGIVLGTDGAPLSRASVTMMSRTTGGPGTINTGAQVRPDGTFELLNVPPGSYALRATILTPGPAPTINGAPVLPTFAVGDVTVNGADVTGVVLAPLQPAKIRGRIVFEQPIVSSMTASDMRIIARPIAQDSMPMPMGPPAVARDDFSFELTAAPGLVALNASIPPGWVRQKAVRARGLDVTDTGLELKPGETIDDVEIEMTERQQVVQGQVLDSRGQPAKQFSVVLFSQDPGRWVNPTNRYWSVAVPQPRGGYKMSTLPPGDYYAFAVAGQQSIAEFSDPDFLESAARNAARFSLREGDSVTLDLKIQPR